MGWINVLHFTTIIFFTSSIGLIASIQQKHQVNNSEIFFCIAIFAGLATCIYSYHCLEFYPWQRNAKIEREKKLRDQENQERNTRKNQLQDSSRVKILALVKKHLRTLATKRIRLLVKDEYGKEDMGPWSQEIQVFFGKIIIPELTDDEKQSLKVASWPPRSHSDLKFISAMLTAFIEIPVQKEVERLDAKLGETRDVESLNPLEYERFCASLLTNCGWSCELTKATGDQGVDIVAKKGNTLLVVQCKKYASPVGNKAVQEILAAKTHLRASGAAVVTNNSYTQSAIEISNTTGVLLLHHTDLIDFKL